MLHTAYWQLTRPISQQGERQTAVSQMTDGKDGTISRRHIGSEKANCSTPALQPQETRDRRELTDGLMAPKRTRQQHIINRRLSVRYAGTVLCTRWYATTHNRMDSLRGGRVTSAIPVAMKLYVLTSGASRRVERQQLAWTAAIGPADIDTRTELHWSGLVMTCCCCCCCCF